jgi:hypothetical protein
VTMATVNGRLCGPPMRSPPQHKEDSALVTICWYNFQLHQQSAVYSQHQRQLISCQGSSAAFFNPLRMIWLRKCQVFTILPSSVGKCTLDKLDVWLRRGLKNITDLFVCTILRTLQWWNAASTWAFKYSYKTPLFWRRCDGWTGS